MTEGKRAMRKQYDVDYQLDRIRPGSNAPEGMTERARRFTALLLVVSELDLRELSPRERGALRHVLSEKANEVTAHPYDAAATWPID